MSEFVAVAIPAVLCAPLIRSIASLSARAAVRACLCRKDKAHEC